MAPELKIKMTLLISVRRSFTVEAKIKRNGSKKFATQRNSTSPMRNERKPSGAERKKQNETKRSETK